MRRMCNTSQKINAAFSLTAAYTQPTVGCKVGNSCIQPIPLHHLVAVVNFFTFLAGSNFVHTHSWVDVAKLCWCFAIRLKRRQCGRACGDDDPDSGAQLHARSQADHQWRLECGRDRQGVCLYSKHNAFATESVAFWCYQQISYFMLSHKIT